MHRPWELPEWYSRSADMTCTPTGTVVCCVGRSWRRRKRRRHVRRSTSWRLPSTTPYRNDLLTYSVTFHGRSNEPGMSVYSLSIQVQSNKLGMSKQAKYWVFIVSRAQSSKFVVCVTLCIINEFVVKSQLETFVVVKTVQKHARQSDYSMNLFIRFISQIISFSQHPTWMALYSLIVLICRKETNHSLTNEPESIHSRHKHRDWPASCCCARNCDQLAFDFCFVQVSATGFLNVCHWH